MWKKQIVLTFDDEITDVVVGMSTTLKFNYFLGTYPMICVSHISYLGKNSLMYRH
jgi:hypothetical protein